MMHSPRSATRPGQPLLALALRPRRGAIAGVIAMATLLMLGSCSDPVSAPPLYRAATAASRDISITVEAAGVIEPVTTVEVKSKASGEVLELNVETGQTVANGSLIVRIDQRTPRNNVAQAEAALEVAKARLENSHAQLRRTEQLFKTKALSEVDYERATLDVANNKADVVRTTVLLQNARIAMEDTDVRAPITGTIIDRLVERGQVISSPIADFGGGSLLLKMAELGHVQVRASVDETDIGKIGPGIIAKVSVTAFPNRTFEGRVRKIEPQASNVQNVTMFPVLIDLDNRAGLLKPGMNATVNIDIAHRDHVLAVPNAALRTAVDAADAAQLLGLPREIVANLTPLPPASNSATPPIAQSATPPGASPSSADPAFSRALAAVRHSSGFDGQLGGEYIVFVKKDKTYEPRRVRGGITDLDYTEVTHGLREGEELMILPSASLARAQQEFKDRMNKLLRMPGSGKSKH